MTDKLDQILSPHQTALGLRAYRQEVLSANIANAATPGYTSRDFDFGTALKAALGPSQGTANTVDMVRTSAGHLPGVQPTAQPAALLYRVPYQSSLDGNTVEMDQERGSFAQNAVQYEATLSFVSSHIKSLLSVLQG